MWIVPTRCRPNNCQRLIASEWNTGLVLCIDSDDPLMGAYVSLPVRNSVMITGNPPGIGLAAIYNREFRALQDLPWFGIGADDMLPESPGWDLRLVNAAGRDGLAYGDDGRGPGHRPTHFVLGGDLVREIGWLALPGLQRLYIDTVWSDIARSRGVERYCADVKLTHVHFSTGAPMDAVYRKSPETKAHDLSVYTAWRETACLHAP